MLRTLTLAAALALAAAPLAGCGFTPMYATPAVSPALASIDPVLPGTSRTGFFLKEQLNHELARDQDEPAHYRLTLDLSEYRVPRGVRVNNVANRYEINVTARYSLTDAATAKVLYTGQSAAVVSYDSADPPYAGVAANQDGEQRAAEQVAIQIRLALARYFERQAVPGA
jgi:LPS-assembly lipoprotein